MMVLIVNWIKVALVTGVHDSIFKFFPQCPERIQNYKVHFLYGLIFIFPEDNILKYLKESIFLLII